MLRARPALGVRCPFCHAALGDARATRCAGCGALAHADCALELARCAACGVHTVDTLVDGADGWDPRAVRGAQGVVAAVRVTRDAPPAALVDARGRAAPLALRLDLLRRRATPDGLLAGEVTLLLPRSLSLGALRLVARGPARGLFRRHLERVVHLLGPERGHEPWVAGLYRVAFRCPARALGAAGDVGVAAVLERARSGSITCALSARLERVDRQVP
jgi:hypothetical protein